MTEKEIKAMGVRKFQRVFGIILIVLSLILIILSGIGLKNLLQSTNANIYHNDKNFSVESNQIIRMESLNLLISNQTLKVNLDLSILLISFISFLMGILFYTEGKKE